MNHPSSKAILRLTGIAAVIIVVILVFWLIKKCCQMRPSRTVFDNLAELERPGVQMPVTPTKIPHKRTVSQQDLTVQLTKNIINENSKKSTFTMQVKDFSSDGNCVVCLERFSDKNVVRKLLKCGHIFHEHCLTDWIKTDLKEPKCPHCN